jgi:hypothetical protein
MDFVFQVVDLLVKMMHYVHFLLAFITDVRGQAKVADLKFHVTIKQEITKFDITVDDVVGMNMSASLQQLMHEVTNFRFRQRPPHFQQLSQGLMSHTVIETLLLFT